MEQFNPVDEMYEPAYGCPNPYLKNQWRPQNPQIQSRPYGPSLTGGEDAYDYDPACGPKRRHVISKPSAIQENTLKKYVKPSKHLQAGPRTFKKSKPKLPKSTNFKLKSPTHRAATTKSKKSIKKSIQIKPTSGIKPKSIKAKKSIPQYQLIGNPFRL